MKKDKLLYLSAGIILLIAAFSLSFQPVQPFQEEAAPAEATPVVFSAGKDIIIEAEVADAPEERRTGLMNRSFLGENKGMLFIFDGEAVISFWMKNTLIPLDMIFLSEERKIVHIKQNAPPCMEDPCPTFSSQFPTKYVVEVNGGFTEKKGIKTGDRAEFSV